MHCGQVHTSPYLPFDTDNAGVLKVAGIGVPKSQWLWMHIEYAKAKILVDRGWSRRISPVGEIDRKAQIAELGRVLYSMNQGYCPGIADNRKEQLVSLQWIREMSLNGDCIESLANHDVEVKPHVIEL